VDSDKLGGDKSLPYDSTLVILSGTKNLPSAQACSEQSRRSKLRVASSYPSIRLLRPDKSGLAMTEKKCLATTDRDCSKIS